MTIQELIRDSISNPVDSGWTRSELDYMARTGQMPERPVSYSNGKG